MKALLSHVRQEERKYSFRLFFCNDKLIELPEEWLLLSKGDGDKYFYLRTKMGQRGAKWASAGNCKPLFLLAKIAE